VEINEKDVQALKLWRAKPSEWVKQHIDVELAHYRDEADFLAWLAKQPPDRHLWARRQYEAGKLILDPTRSYQAEALDQTAPAGRYAVQWANGVGKTGFLALRLLHALDVYPSMKIVTTAGTWSQLKEQLWREIAFWASKAKSPIVANASEILTTSVEIDNDWVAFGRASSDEKTFEGVHGRYVTVLMDESKAIKQGVWNAGTRILRGADGLFWWICAGSPASPTGEFWEVTNGDKSHHWQTLRMSAYESERIGLDEIERDCDELGDESPLFISMDCGEFPDETEDTIIPLSHVQACVDREVNTEGIKALAVDVARFGSDETILLEMRGRRVEVVETYNGRDLMQTAGRAKVLSPEYDRLGVDDTGLGGGVTDRLREQNVETQAFIAGGRAQDADTFVNLTSERVWALRQLFREGFENPTDPNKGISIPNDKRLIHQLSARKYKYRSDGKIAVEPKDEMKKRGEKSPDRADALAIAYWLWTMPSTAPIVVDGEYGGAEAYQSRGL